MTVFESLMMAIAFGSLIVTILSFNHIEDFHQWGPYPH
ncbi:putative holin-like toxin [Mesobacillus persicus]|nr:putative holin-like toxin [Mesobacillus persicus]